MLTRVELTMDCADPARLAEFWKTAAGYVNEPPPAPFATREEWLASFDDEYDDGMGGAWLHDPSGVAPRLCLLQVPEPKTAKNRLHVDLRVSGDGTPDEKWARVSAEATRLRDAGAQVLQTFEGHHVVMADPEGNEFCLA
ncbi:MAG: VOC family protein [Jatrophihabitans sp.]|uniref:VOC family protein n=1 Tax=Jatrophihabitans sp. TaxID=1932789 RepID=UPI00390F2911